MYKRALEMSACKVVRGALCVEPYATARGLSVLSDAAFHRSISRHISVYERDVKAKFREHMTWMEWRTQGMDNGITQLHRWHLASTGHLLGILKCHACASTQVPCLLQHMALTPGPLSPAPPS